MGGLVVPEFRDLRVPLEGRLHDRALDSATAAMHEPHFPQTRFGGGAHVVCHNSRDVSRRECVKVELVFDGNTDGRIRHTEYTVPNADCRTVKRGMENLRSFPAHSAFDILVPHSSRLGVVRGGDHRLDAAAHRKIADDGHPTGMNRTD
jgi:hypothetical protein